MFPSDRRNFLKSAGMVGLGAAVGVPATLTQKPESRPSDHHFQLGLAAYSFRSEFEYSKGKPQKRLGSAPPIDMFDFINYCAQLGISGAELTSYFFPPDADTDYYRRVKQHAFRQGVTICGTAIGNNFSKGRGEYLSREIKAAKAWIDRADEFGAPHIRFFAGTAKDFAGGADRMQVAIEALQECVDYAGERGIFIGVENHGKLTADQVLEIVEGVKSGWFGVNLDTGNFQSEDPYADLERCAPHAVNVQVKVKMKRPDGTPYDADLGKIAGILKAANYQGFVVLEYEEAEPRKHVPEWLDRLRLALS